MNKILVVGSGISGCSLARLIRDKGIQVSILEKDKEIGGLCRTSLYKGKVKYEPFGSRVFHTDNKEVIRFVQRFSDFNDYIHRKGIVIDDRLIPFPLSLEGILMLAQKDKILEELQNRSSKIDCKDFASAMASVFGETLYHLFIENYSKKMWNNYFTNLPVPLGLKRVEFRAESESRLFKDEWQGIPKEGYSIFLERMIEGIHLQKNTFGFNCQDYDLVLFSGPIDEFFNFRFGKLRYRGLRFDYIEDELWENDKYGTINLPQHQIYIRKVNFNVLHQQKSDLTLIQYQEPVEGPKMYPVGGNADQEIFDKYLLLCCSTNIIPVGRLGCYKYLDMDECIKLNFKILEVIEQYIKSDTKTRYGLIKGILEYID